MGLNTRLGRVCSNHRLHSGDIVRVRSREEILSTLDERGTLDNLPFLPEMFEFCDKTFMVSERAAHIWVEGVGERHIRSTIMLEGVRCSGKAHGKCERACNILWKESWLELPSGDRAHGVGRGTVIKANSLRHLQSRSGAYICQSTSLERASHPLPASIESFSYRYLCNNTARRFFPLRIFCAFVIFILGAIKKVMRKKIYYRVLGSLQNTTAISLRLRPGDMVEVKAREEIRKTLDTKGKNRGLAFYQEMAKYFGGRYRVLARVNRVIDEKTGKMRSIDDTVILDGVTCDGGAHVNCPRSCYCLFREIWLRKV